MLQKEDKQPSDSDKKSTVVDPIHFMNTKPSIPLCALSVLGVVLAVIAVYLGCFSKF